MAVSRREMLGRGLALIGAAVGLGVAAPSASKGAPGTLTLGARSLRLAGADGGRALPRRGDRHVGEGELLDDAGNLAGSFYATSFGLESPGQVDLAAPASLQMHTLHLEDGMIMGVGTASLDPDVADTFAIVGGTGRFAAARGTYVAELAHLELGGDGSGRFTFSFTA